MRHNKAWTAEEDDYLFEHVGSKSFSAIAKNLNRTVIAVESRVNRLGLDDTKTASGKLTLNHLANLLKVDNHVVYRWIDKFGLRVVRKVTRTSAKFNLIDISDFWKWAEQNKEKINFAKIEPLSLLPEPDWVEEERKKDYHAIPKRQMVPWTNLEDKRLIEMVNNRYSLQEMVDILNRSEKAVRRRLSRLREWSKIPKKKVSLRWRKEELELLFELERKGLSDEEIALELGREPIHIRDKRRNLRKKGLYQGRKQTIS